jgi:phenylalanine-4-hydroxylase
MVTAKSAPAFYLVVIHAFGTYRRGDQIKDAAEIARVLKSENANSVNRVPA